jgi:hypothetical protein
MAETNPLFETADTPFGLLTVHGSQADQQARQKSKLVSDLVGGSRTAITVVDEPETLVLDLEPSYPTKKNVLRAVYIPETQWVAYLTIDDISPWLPAHYEARKLATSQATAFSNIEALRDKSGPNVVKHLSRYLRSIFQPPYGAPLADRIEALSKMVREESDGTYALSGESLESFIAFLERNPKLVRPSVVAGPSGEVVAIWKGGMHGEFTARFIQNGSVQYLLSRPNPRHPQGTSRLSGDTTPDKLFEDARLSELQWISSR